MNDPKVKKNRKNIVTIFIVAIFSLIAVFIALSVAYAHLKQNWLIWAGITDILMFVLCLISFAFIVWLWDVKDLMTEYKEKDNLISGGLAFTSIFGLAILLSFGLSKIPFLAEGKELMQTMLSLLIAAMPAFIGLLGVQFSVAIQERNRKQDLRLGAKPFFKIQCCKVEAIPDENRHTCHAMRIKVKMTNISQSIGIPLKICSCDSNDCEIALSYNPLANNDHFETEVEVISDTPYCDKINIAIFYKDIYENMYKSKIEFLQHEKYELSNAKVLSDKLISNKNDN